MHQFDQKSLECLQNYSWPGNIREMEHLVERLVITISDQIKLPEHLPPKLLCSKSPEINTHTHNKDIINENPKQEQFPRNYPLKETEKDLIIKLYCELKSSYKVANALKISQSKVSRTVRKYFSDNS